MTMTMKPAPRPPSVGRRARYTPMPSPPKRIDMQWGRLLDEIYATLSDRYGRGPETLVAAAYFARALGDWRADAERAERIMSKRRAAEAEAERLRRLPGDMEQRPPSPSRFANPQPTGGPAMTMRMKAATRRSPEEPRPPRNPPKDAPPTVSGTAACTRPDGFF